jgi:flagellar hook assembly protein FlgD
LFTIGSTGSSTSPINGNLDEIKIFRRVLTSDEVSAMADIPQNYSFLTDIEEESKEDHFIDAFPNPFVGRLTLKITSGQNQFVNAYIYDINGIVVKTYYNKSLVTGNNELFWNGTNDNGAHVNSGMYFIKVVTNSHVDNLTIVKM